MLIVNLMPKLKSINCCCNFLVAFACSMGVVAQTEAQELVRNSSGDTIGFRYLGLGTEINSVLERIQDSDAILEIFLGCHEVKPAEVEALQRFRNLDTLSIGDFPDEISQVSNETLRAITRLAAIRHLEFNVDRSIDVDWSILEGAKSLRSLTIRGRVKFVNADIDGIASLKHLERLWIEGDFAQVRSLQSLKKCRSLTSLSLAGDSIGRFLDDILRSGLRLNQLELLTAYVSEKQLLQIEEFCGDSLQVLAIGFSDVGCFSIIHKFKNLANLAVVMPKSYSIELTGITLPLSLKTFVIRSN